MSDILNQIFSEKKIMYNEKALEVNAAEFKKVVDSRRSVRHFTKKPIPHEVMEECLEMALKAPNSSNLHPFEFYWVRSPEKKAALIKACLGQPAAATAQELVVFVARTNTWRKHAKQIVELFRKSDRDEASGIKVPKSAYFYYEKLVHVAYTQGYFSLIGYFKKIGIFFQTTFLGQVIPREPTSNSDMRVWAHKSCALACENYMLAMRAHGFDTCPMEGMDSWRVKKILGLGSGAEVCMVISAGERADNGVYGPQMRLPREQFIKYV